MSFCKQYDFSDKNFKNYSAIFIFGRPDVSEHFFQTNKFGNWKIVKNVTYDHLIVSGSGTDKWISKFTEQAALHDEGSEILVRATIDKALLTCIYFFEEERVSPENLQNGWGGDFDIIIYEKGEFHRLNKCVMSSKI